MEALRKENLKNQKKVLEEFELDVLTTPKKPIKSIPKLSEAITAFFAAHMDDPYVTLGELAKAVGYADEDSMMKDAFNAENSPKYNALIRKAASKVEDIVTRRMLAISEAAGDTKGFQTALQRMDKKRDKYDPDSAVNENSTQVKVNIQMQENENIKKLLDARLPSLLAAQKGEAIDVTPRQIPEAVSAVNKDALDG